MRNVFGLWEETGAECFTFIVTPKKACYLIFQEKLSHIQNAKKYINFSCKLTNTIPVHWVHFEYMPMLYLKKVLKISFFARKYSIFIKET